MKKLLSLLCVLSFSVVCSACGFQKSSSKSSTEVEVTTFSETTTQAPTAFNYRNMSNEEFAEKIAKDFSTEAVTFTSEKYSDDMYFLNSDNDNVSAHISFSDYGNHLTLSFVTDGGEDECYYVLLKALQSEVFNIPLDNQIDILAHYTMDEIDYEQENLSITETIKENIRVIGIQLQ